MTSIPRQDCARPLANMIRSIERQNPTLTPLPLAQGVNSHLGAGDCARVITEATDYPAMLFRHNPNLCDDTQTISFNNMLGIGYQYAKQLSRDTPIGILDSDADRFNLDSCLSLNRESRMEIYLKRNALIGVSSPEPNRVILQHDFNHAQVYNPVEYFHSIPVSSLPVLSISFLTIASKLLLKI